MNKKLSVDFLGIKVNSPLVVAAGIMGVSYSTLIKMYQCGAGIVTTKSLTIEPRTGHKGPIIAEFNGGLINSVGLSNPGIDDGLKEVEEFKKNLSMPVIVSIFGSSAEEFEKLIKCVNDSKADFVELNLSCPNVSDEFGIPLSASGEAIFEIVSRVKKISKRPVIAKLSPNVIKIKDIAVLAQKAGADALSLINTVGPGMLIDIKTVKPVLYNFFGGLSGPCIKPIAIRAVYEVYSCVDIPIIGMGGIMTGSDAVEIMMAGATLVGIGSGVYYRGVEIFKKVNREMIIFLKENGYSNIKNIKKLDKLNG